VRWKRSASFVVVLLAVLALSACGGTQGGNSGTTTAAVSTTTSTQSSGSGGCKSVTAPATQNPSPRKAPTSSLDPNKTYRVVVQTSCGDFTITLDVKASPKTTASFVSLADSGFFDNTIFHRIAPGFVIQGGDPTARGTGGPGYLTVEPPPKSTQYVKYVVAMAKTSAQAPGTAGSQFFVVTAPDAQLPPEYALLGKVTEGQSVVNLIGTMGDPSTEQPTQPIVIDKMSVQTS
jgi:cyclophilin family peptidyl-prolyl cis-trans isomerase